MNARRITNSRSPRAGVAGTWVAIAFVALAGSAALVIDLGGLSLAAQRCQDVADAAALAAANQLPDTTRAAASASDIVAANSADSSRPVVLDPTSDIVYFGPGESVSGYGVLQQGEHAVRTTTHVEVAYTFGRILGIEGATATRSATALSVSEGGDSTCIWANAELDSSLIFPLDIIEVSGLVHSNGAINVSGESVVFHSVVEYNRYLNDTADNTVYEQGHRTCDVAPYPIDYTEHDFGLFDQIIYGDWSPHSDSLTVSGVIRVYGSVNTRVDTFIGNNCTIIADGNISIAGEAPVMTPALHDVVLFSLYGDINTTADGTQIDGIVFAPNGHIDYLGDGQRVASLIGNTVSLHGDSCDVVAVPGIGGGQASVRLIH